MKPRTALLLVLPLVFLLGSCDAMFEGNIFQKAGLGQLDLAAIDTGDAAAIADATKSPGFFTQLQDDSIKLAEVIATLAANPTMENLVLLGVIEVKASDAGVVVDNLADQLTALADSGSTEPDMGAILNAILPASIFIPNNPESPAPQAFIDIIQAFADAATSFTSVSDTIAADGGALPAVGDMTSEDVAYYALASVAVDAIGIDETSPFFADNPDATVAEAIWAAVNGETTAITIDQTIFAIDPSDDSTTPLTTVEVLLSAAGIDLSAITGSNSTTP